MHQLEINKLKDEDLKQNKKNNFLQFIFSLKFLPKKNDVHVVG
jgi:hypothetical protein